MNRRDALKAGVVTIPAAALVASPRLAAAPGARVAWIALCRPVEGVDDGWPSGHEYAERQRRLGRRVVQVLERAADTTLVVVEQPCSSDADALALLDRFNRECLSSSTSEFTRDFGDVWAITMLAAGQVLDVMAFLRMRADDEFAGLLGRVRRLEEWARGPGGRLV